MGCVVNGPGESKHADIGISLPGTFEEPVAPVFIDGRLDRTLRGDGLVPEFMGILDDYVARRYPGAGRAGRLVASGRSRPRVPRRWRRPMRCCHSRASGLRARRSGRGSCKAAPDRVKPHADRHATAHVAIAARRAVPPLGRRPRRPAT